MTDPLKLRHPFFRPRWRRIAIVVFLAIWAAVEFLGGSPLWGYGIGALAAYTGWEYFLNFDPANYADPTDTKDEDAT